MDGVAPMRWLAAAQRTEPASFRAVYERHAAKVYAHLAFRTRNRHLAEDLTGETFERALRAYERFHGHEGRVLAWLLRIADSAYADHFRREARNPRPLPGPRPIEQTATPSAESAVFQDAAADRIYTALDALPWAQRAVVLMRLGQSLSHRQIGRRLGRREGAVRMLYFRALATLREQLSLETE
jgi:RNA polymerase sigma factor (sigma-70 family)